MYLVKISRRASIIIEAEYAPDKKLIESYQIRMGIAQVTVPILSQIGWFPRLVPDFVFRAPNCDFFQFY